MEDLHKLTKKQLFDIFDQHGFKYNKKHKKDDLVNQLTELLKPKNRSDADDEKEDVKEVEQKEEKEDVKEYDEPEEIQPFSLSVNHKDKTTDVINLVVDGVLDQLDKGCVYGRNHWDMIPRKHLIDDTGSTKHRYYLVAVDYTFDEDRGQVMLSIALRNKNVIQDVLVFQFDDNGDVQLGGELSEIEEE